MYLRLRSASAGLLRGAFLYCSPVIASVNEVNDVTKATHFSRGGFACQYGHRLHHLQGPLFPFLQGRFYNGHDLFFNVGPSRNLRRSWSHHDQRVWSGQRVTWLKWGTTVLPFLTFPSFLIHYHPANFNLLRSPVKVSPSSSNPSIHPA